MAYVRRTWQERVGTLLNRFAKSSETASSVVLVNDPDTITQAGTPFSAAAMNNIEDGIVEALAKVPTGVNNNILLSDGAGNAKDSGKAIGNASGNVPIANGTKCVNLYTADTARLVEQAPHTSGNIVTRAVSDKSGSRFRFDNEGGGIIGLPASSPPTYGMVETWGTDGDILFCFLRDSLSLSTWIARVYTGWSGLWTRLTNADGSPAQLPLTPSYDLVIDSDAKLAAWAASGTYAKVLIKAGTWTLASGGVNLTARGTKQVVGEPGSLLVFSSATKGLYYTTQPSTPEYHMEGVKISISSSVGAVCAAFYYGQNLTNCEGTALNSPLANCYGFYSCVNLNFCNGAGTSASGTGTGFSQCYQLSNCVGTGTGAANSHGFSACYQLVNCTGTGSGSNPVAIGFYACEELTNCRGMGIATGTAGAGFHTCIGVVNCQGVGTGATGYGYTACKKCVCNKALSASTTATYNTNSYADAGTAAACADTAAGGWNS